MADFRNLSLTGGTKSRRESTKGVSGTGKTYAKVIGTTFTDSKLDPNQIQYRNLETGHVGYAYPIHTGTSTIPLVDEYVEIIKAPAGGSAGKVDYYTAHINVWNHPQHGATTDGNPPILAPEFIERVDINPMRPFPGDIILEGRTGQSIRFSEGFSNTPWTSPSASQPVIIITNGQVTTQEGESYIVEDINTDAASIYLTSDHKVPLRVSKQWNREGSTSYATAKIPLAADVYSGEQAIINSGRLYFNASKESLLLSAEEHVGILGNEVHLDATVTINLEAPTIRLTGDSLNPSLQQSAVKGDELVSELTNLYNYLLNVTDLLTTVASATNNPDGVRRAIELAGWLKTSSTGLNEKLLSKKVFLT